jgi:hypothetical protein
LSVSGTLRWRNGIPACIWHLQWRNGIVFLLVFGAPAVVKLYSCLCLMDLRLCCLYLGHLRWRNACTWVAKCFSWLYLRQLRWRNGIIGRILGHLRWRNGIPACIWWTCGGGMVFLVVSGALAVAKLHSSYLGHLRWPNNMIACIWRTYGGNFVFMLVSGAPAVAKWYSCLYLGHLRWCQEGFGQISAKSVMVLPEPKPAKNKPASS